MGYEIVNNAQITPHRLHALLRVIPRLREPRRQDIYDLLQPEDALPKLTNQEAAKAVFTAARTCGLVIEGAEQVVVVQRTLDEIEQFSHFRSTMQRTLLGATDDSADQFLLNLFTAWYAVQDDAVFRYELKDFEVRFNEQLFPEVDGREFNTTKFNGWRTWAPFLGFGWLMRVGTFELLAPDAFDRLLPLLHELLPEEEQFVAFAPFAERLAERCPELDGGILFERCWRASRGAEMRGNQLSLMLSNALRGLDHAQYLELQLQADAATRWQLFPATGHPHQQVSHIRRRRTA